MPSTIRSRLIFILVLSLSGLLILAITSLYAEYNNLLEDRKVKTRHVVQVAASVVRYFHEKQTSGAMSETDAKAAALAAVKALRYEKDDYFWINDMQPVMIMHPTKPELDGKDLSSLKDPNGVALFSEFVKTVRGAGAGFVAYDWPKPGAPTPQPKISYVEGFTPWGWVIGSGIYIDDVKDIFIQSAVKLMAILLVCIVIIGTLTTMVVRSITRSISAIKENVLNIRQTRDLTRRADATGHDEMSQIASAFNELVSVFQNTIQHVLNSSTEVKRLSTTLALSAGTVAEASIRQSESSTAMAAAVEEAQANIEHVSSNARSAHSKAEEAGNASVDGKRIVENAADEMVAIAASVGESATHIQKLGEMSEQISLIVTSIKEIADQTNLLALNAAIEAARAGEAGRGFAVVADEVRKLAERTANSTVQIGTMITNIHDGTQQAVLSMNQGNARVGGGVELARAAGQSIGQIRNGADEVIAAVRDIAYALEEQTQATELIVQNVEQIASLAQNNSEATQGIAGSASQLEELARSLELEVSGFKV